MSDPRYLAKSLIKLSPNCETKLFYTKKTEYPDKSVDDSFLESLAAGGAAMMAYARIQFSEMTHEEREKVISGLLRYCELDTFAMVLLWEFFVNEFR